MGELPIVNILPFDVESYISRYQPLSNITIKRLLFLASKSVVEEEQEEQSKEKLQYIHGLLEERLKRKGNIVYYRQLFDPNTANHKNDTLNENNNNMDLDGNDDDMIMGMAKRQDNGNDVMMNSVEPHYAANRHCSSIPFDNRYIQKTESQFQSQLQTLEANLSNSQSHLSQESIRKSYMALAKFYHNRGGMSDKAIHFYQRAKECCTTSSSAASAVTGEALSGGTRFSNDSRLARSIASSSSSSNYHLQEIILSIAECAIEIQTNTEYNKIITNHTHYNTDVNNTELFNSKLKCVRAMSYLNQGEYYLAALTFLSIKQKSFTNDLNHILSAEDLALYGGLLGLITLDRAKIKNMVLIEAWRSRLELFPSLQEAIHCYMKADYGSCLKHLTSLKGYASMDVFLNPHLDTLWTMMREKFIVQYFQPYTSVSLVTMKESFGFDHVDEVEDIIAALIESKRIVGAKIDGVNKTLTRMSVQGLEEKRRNELMKKVGLMGDRLIDEVEGMILRMSCLENDVVVVDENAGNKRKNSSKSSREGGDSTYDQIIAGYSSSEEDTYELMI